MSDVSLEIIARLGPRLKALLFAGPSARFLVAVTRVITEEASAQTQGPAARKLGRRLLVEAARGNAATPKGLEACFEEGCRCAERFLAAGQFPN